MLRSQKSCHELCEPLPIAVSLPNARYFWVRHRVKVLSLSMANEDETRSNLQQILHLPIWQLSFMQQSQSETSVGWRYKLSDTLLQFVAHLVWILFFFFSIHCLLPAPNVKVQGSIKSHRRTACTSIPTNFEIMGQARWSDSKPPLINKVSLNLYRQQEGRRCFKVYAYRKIIRLPNTCKCPRGICNPTQHTQLTSPSFRKQDMWNLEGCLIDS